MHIKRPKRPPFQYSRIGYLFLLLLPCLPVKSMAAGDDDSEKRKTISKSYTVTADDKLRIENSFGEVRINTWEKNEIKVDIEIVAKSNTDERAQELLDEINVDEHRDGNTISYKTNIGDAGNGSHRNKNSSKGFQIDYKIYMPSANRLQIENSFGETIVPDFNGEVNLTSKFGSLNTGQLRHVDAIDVEFGSASIGSINGGKATFKYDAGTSIGKISGSVKLNIEFSSRVQFALANDIEELLLNESYSTLRMVVDKALSARFEIHSSFGTVHNETGFSIKEDRDPDNDSGPRFDIDYNGQSGDGKAHIKVKSSFGTLNITHVAAEDRGSRKNKDDKNADNDDDDNDDDKKSGKEHA